MTRYKLTEDTPFGKKGLIYTHQSDSDTASAREDDVVWTMTSTEVFMFKKLGVLEEVREDGKWVPKDGEYYWYATASGANSVPWHKDEIDSWMTANGNMFRTEEEAEAYRVDKLKGL